MSADKNYGDPCDNEECKMYRNGKCRKNEEFYDNTIPVEERLETLTMQLISMIELDNKLKSEIKQMIKIGITLSHDLDNTESIDNILNDIEKKMSEQ